MKRLYFVSLYSHSDNAFIRLMVTVNENHSADDAEFLARDYRPGYRVSNSVFICTTNDNVFTEV